MTTRPRRLLILLDHLQNNLGGGERTALRLATDMPARGYDVWMCTTRGAQGWPLAALADAGVRHVDATRERRGDLRGLEPLWRTLRDERIDIVHAHMHGSNVWGTVLGRLAGVPLVVAHEHSWPFEGEPVRRVVDGAIGRIADAFVAVSNVDARLMHEYERVPVDKIHVIPSAWEARRNGDTTTDVRGELGIPADALVVGTLALMRPVKRLDLLVEAFAQVLESVPDAWLLIVGEGDDRPRIEAAVEQFGVGHRTRLPGFREDVEAVWRTLDVGAMSSEREGMPMAALEAMAHGVPMVAPAVGGIVELFEQGGGIAVEPQNPRALAEAISGLLLDPEARRSMGAIGRECARDYTVDRQVERCLALYDALMASPRAQRRIKRRGSR